MEKNFSIKEFFCSKIGSYVLIAGCALVVFLIMVLCIEISPYLCIIPSIPIFYYGWTSLQKIQPNMFLWLSWAGWILYFFIKAFLAALIGYFVTPYKLGIKLSEKIKEKYNIQ